jgi:hypothetical protein
MYLHYPFFTVPLLLVIESPALRACAPAFDLPRNRVFVFRSPSTFLICVPGFDLRIFFPQIQAIGALGLSRWFSARHRSMSGGLGRKPRDAAIAAGSPPAYVRAEPNARA